MTRSQIATMILSSPRMRAIKNIHSKGAKKREQQKHTKHGFIEENSLMRIQAEYLKPDGADYPPHKI